VTRALGVLLIPAISLTLPIVFAPQINGMHQIPDSGAGWLEGTGWIYDVKWRVVLGGHTPGDFEDIVKLAPGDVIIIVGEQGPVRYRVLDTGYVDANDMRWLAPQADVHRLTLLTCTSSARLRYIENAERIEGTG
jgi:LPXTG-site transpeptidase (sortase) family protein